jgi:hypothetical protein
MLNLLNGGGTSGSIQQRGLGDWLAEDVALEEVREPHFGLVFEVDGCWDGKDLCD